MEKSATEKFKVVKTSWCFEGGTYFVVDVVAAHAVGVHEVGAALACAWGTLGDVGVVFGAPIVAEFVRCD